LGIQNLAKFYKKIWQILVEFTLQKQKFPKLSQFLCRKIAKFRQEIFFIKKSLPET